MIDSPEYKRWERKLDRKGVQVVDPYGLWLRCNSCGQPWSPNIQTGGRLPRGYWRCPNECNANIVSNS